MSQGITLGMKSILASKRIILIGFGSSKVKALKALMAGESAESFPVAALRNHDEVSLYTLAETLTSNPQ